jgi:hypothetical protein
MCQQIGVDPAASSHIEPPACLDHVRDFAPVREGALRHLNLFALAGIVTFPSFHAASAALYAWALWPVRWMRPLALLANGAMLASTPIDGATISSTLSPDWPSRSSRSWLHAGYAAGCLWHCRFLPDAQNYAEAAVPAE